MALNRNQKRFVRENHLKSSVQQLAKKLGVAPRDVRRALRELGLASPEEREAEQPAQSARAEADAPAPQAGPGWLQRLGAHLAWIERAPFAFAVVVGVAFLLRMIHLLETMDSPFFLHLHTDAFMYDHWARQIAGGDWLGLKEPVFYLGPFYPYFLAIIYAVFGPSPLAACWFQVILSALSAGLVLYLGRRLFGPVTGFIAGLIAALYKMFIFYSGLVLATTLILFLNLALLALLVSALGRPAWWRWMLAGALLGLSACTHGSIILFGPLAVLAIGIHFGLSAWRRWLSAGAIMATSSLMVISPVTLHNALAGGDRVLLTSNMGVNLFIGNNANADGIYMRNARYRGRPMGLSVAEQQANFPEVARTELGRNDLRPSEISSFWTARALEEIAADPARWLHLEGQKLRYMLNAYEVPNNRNIAFSERFSLLLRLPLPGFGLVMPLGLAGMVLAWRGFRKRGVLVWYFLAQVLVMLAFFVNDRYRLVLVPALIIYAGAAIRWLGLLVGRRKWRKLGLSAGLIGLLLVVAHLPVQEIGFRANFLNLGNAYRDLGHSEEALASYDEALRLSPDFYYAQFKKGELLARLGRNDEARPLLERALELARAFGDSLNARRIESLLERLRPGPTTPIRSRDQCKQR